MTTQLLDLVMVSVASAPGTATTINLGPVIGGTSSLSFSAAGATDGGTYSYKINDGNQVEKCSGVFDASANTITRVTRIASVNGVFQDTPINASANAIISSDIAAEGIANATTSIGGLTGAVGLTAPLETSGSNIALASPALYQTANGSALNPASTASTSGMMMGLGSTLKITPNFSTRVEVTISVGYAQAAGNQNVTTEMTFGTGTPPSNGASGAGAAIGSTTISGGSNIAVSAIPLTLHAYVTGLTPGTTYWFDLLVSTGDASFPASVHNVTASIREF